MKNLKELAITIIKKNYIYILGVILLTFKGILLNIMLDMQIGSEMYLITAAIPMLLLLPIINRKEKFSYIYLNIVYYIITLLIYSNYIYYNYSTNFLSIYQVENIKYAEEIGMSLIYLITFKTICIFWIDNILLTLFSIYNIYRKKTKQKNINKNDKKEDISTETLKISKKKHFKYIFYILIILLNLLIISNKIERTYEYYTYNKTLMMEHIAIYYYHFEDLKDYILEFLIKEKVDYERLDEIYSENIKNKEDKTDFTGISEKSNVLIVQMESLNEFIINKKINGKEITPNLNKFFNENIYLANMYNQGLGTTADSEHTLSTGMFPLENGRVFQKYYGNNWENIYSNLREHGYYTSFMHPNVSTFWNRYQVYNSGYKIDEYNDISKFNDNGEMAGEFFSDEQFFTQSVAIIDKYEKPFLTTLVSVSTHIPYSLEGIKNLEDKLTIDVSNIEEEEISNYLLACNFSDYSFGKLIEELEKTNILDDTILIVYGDHGAGLQNTDIIKQIHEENNKEYTETKEKLENVHIPFGIRIPNNININNTFNFVIEEAKSKIDIKNTITDLLGIKDTFSIGQSIFTNKDYSFVKGIGFITKDVYYVDGEYIDRKTNEKIEVNEDLYRLENKMNDEMFFSDTIIKNNLVSRFIKENN